MRRLLCLKASRPFQQRGAASLLDQMESEQKAREEALGERKVVFASATSSDNRPRQAAQEAFEVASSALSREPNFCLVNVSLDLETMIDAPEMIWGMLRSVSNNNGRMIGTAVNKQRFGGGFIQVLLGSIPDLEMDVFTMDSVPTKEFLTRENVPPAFACLTTIDATLARYHEAALHHHLSSLKSRLGAVPFSGGVLQPVGRKDDSSNDSIAFVDDRVYKGSAVACVLRSRNVSASNSAIVPSIELGQGKVSIAESSDGVTRIVLIDGKVATDVIRELYEAHLPHPSQGRIFIGVRYKETLVPLAFSGSPSDGSLTLVVPEGVQLSNEDTVYFVCDDPILDTEAIAGSVLKDFEKVSPISVEKNIVVARESRKFVTASSCAGIHFSNGLLNFPVRRDDVLAVGNGVQLFVPPVITRAIGRQSATTGIYCPAQVVDIAGEPFIVPRASSNMIWSGTE